jgi:hypothetical protein
MVPLLRCNDATLRSVIGNLFINELSASLRGQYGTLKSPFSAPSLPLRLAPLILPFIVLLVAQTN